MKYLKVFTDFTQCVKPLQEAEQGRLFLAMLRYAESGQETPLRGNERFVWPVAKQIIDREAEFCEKQRRKAEKGGRPAGKKPAKTRKTQKDKDKEKEKDNDNDKRGVPLSMVGDDRILGSFGNVHLTDGEIEDLRERFPTDWARKVERLSRYMAESGRRYENHWATIATWAEADAEDPPLRCRIPMDFDI